MNGLAEEISMATARIGGQLAAIEAKMRLALKGCREHKREKNRAEAAAPGGVEIIRVLLPPWFWSGVGGGTTGGAFDPSNPHGVVIPDEEDDD